MLEFYEFCHELVETEPGTTVGDEGREHRHAQMRTNEKHKTFI